MKPVMHRLTILNLNVIVILLLTSFLSLGVIGCMHPDGSDSMTFQVIPVGSRDVADLSSDDVVRIMRRSGFSDDQILELGTKVRNSLLSSGAVEIKRGRIIEAIFAVNDKNVFITTRLRGNFIYNVEKGTWIGFEKVVPQSNPQEGTSQTRFGDQNYLNQPAFPDR